MRLLAICAGYFMVILDVTIVNVALPSIGHALGGGVSALQWILDAYTIAFAGLLLSAGSLADRLGARRVFCAGLGLFTLTSAACAAAPSIGVLIAARLLQGVGAALLVPSSLALLRASYEDPSQRARAVGMWGAVAGIGAASGPVLGGLLIAAAGWRAVFLVNVPVGAGALALALRTLPRARRPDARVLDPAGQALGIATLALLTLGLIEGGAAGWSSLRTLLPLAICVPALAAFVATERRSRHPMLPLGLLRSPTLSGASFAGLAINLGFYGQLFVMTLYFQHVRGMSALDTGLALLPEGAFVAIASAVSGRVTARVGPRRPMLIGLLVGAAGLAAMMIAGRTTPYLVLVPALVAAGIGIAATMPAATAAVIDAAPGDRAGIASGVLNASRQAGGAVGVALLGTLLTDSQSLAMAAAAGVFLLGALVTAFTVAPGRTRAA